MLRAWMRLIRLPNALLAGVSVPVAGYLAVGEFFFPGWYWSVAGAVSLFAAGNIDNDVADVAIDRINRPERPLPAGRISVRTAVLCAWLLAVAGLAFSFALGLLPLMIACVAWAVLLVYNRLLKRMPLIGNLAVAGLSSLLFVYVGAVVGGWGGLLPAAGFAFLVHLARELAKDLEDRVGDAALGARTLAVISSAATRIVAVVALLGAIAMAFAAPRLTEWGPFASRWLGPVVVLLVLPGMLCLLDSRNATRLTWAVRSLKIAMPLGLLLLCFLRW